MPCFRPLKGYRSATVNPDTGKRSIVFNPRHGFVDLPVDVPCGQCIGCRLERSRQWAIRCVHENSLHEESCFITLTYDDENLPEGGSLRLKDWQDFMKRLRKAHGTGIRFFHCGEYGERFARPHYHAVLFGFDFSDKTVWKSRRGNTTWRSKELERLWPWGISEIGAVTFESAAYVARYIMKKQTGPKAEDHYGGRKPEYTTMSRRPGIGKNWIEKWVSDVYPRDKVVMRGKEMKPPKFYDTHFELAYPSEFATIKARRKANAVKKQEHDSIERLAVREECATQRAKRLIRSYENES